MFRVLLKDDFPKWEWYGDVCVTMLFIHLILTAEEDGRQWRGNAIGCGELVSTPARLASATGLSEKNVRTAVRKLVATGYITTRRIQGYTVYTITNHDEYGRWMG